MLCFIMEVGAVSKIVFLSWKRPCIVIRYFCGDALGIVFLMMLLWFIYLWLYFFQLVIVFVIGWMILVSQERWRLFLAFLTDFSIVLPMLQGAFTPWNIATLSRCCIFPTFKDRLPLNLSLILIFELNLFVILTHLIIILTWKGIKDEGQRTIFTFFARTEATDSF